jgi:hypothetical protein
VPYRALKIIRISYAPGPRAGPFRSAALRISSLGDHGQYRRCKRRSGTGDSLQQIERGTEDNPFDTILITLSKGLPNGLFLGRLPRDTDSGTTTALSRILLYLSEFNPFRGDQMTGICEIKHAPMGCVEIWFRDLEEREIGGVWRGESESVDRGDDSSVGDCPFETARGFTANYA